jgi:uncharacterized protein (DUF3820 family)
LSDEFLKLKIDLIENYLDVFSRVDPGYTTWRGRILEEYASPYLLWTIRQHKKGLASEADCQKAIIKGLMFLKESVKCRQFDQDSIKPISVALLMKSFNDIVASIQK